jgi:opacity protein-like surface antigen
MKKIIISVILTITACQLVAQDTASLLNGMEEKAALEKVTGTFKSTRVIMSHSTEMLHKGDMDFRIMHRFGVLSNGFKDLFGLDYASMRMSFDYGITDKIMIGLGRSTALKDLDIFIKTRLLQQTKGEKQMPVSLLLAAGYIVTTQESFAVNKPSFGDRSSYYLQMIVGRKFNSRFSLQFNPLLLHNNSTLNPTDNNTILGLGAGARYKVSKRIALMLDYSHAIGDLGAAARDPLSIGVDIETGGHVFQLHFTNATGMNEKSYLTQTTGDWFKGDVRFGFNLSRIFHVGKKRKQL